MTDTNVLHAYVRVLRARWTSVALVVLIAVIISVAYSVLTKPSYDATTTIQFTSLPTDIGILTPGVQTPVDISPSQTAAANAQAVTQPNVLSAVESVVKSGMNQVALRNAVQATVQPSSNLIAIAVMTGNANLSARLANEFALQTAKASQVQESHAYASEADQLVRASRTKATDRATKLAYQQAIARLRLLSKVSNPVQIVSAASVPGSPSSPKPALDVTLAVVLGLMIGIGVAFIRNAFDRRLTDGHAVADEMKLPLLGYIPEESLGFAAGNGHGPTPPQKLLETFRIVRTNAAFLTADRTMSAVVVTSPVAGEGKSTVSAWYAWVSAASGCRTLIIDCDLRKPLLAQRFGVEPTPGLSDFLAGDASSHEILRSIEVEGPDAVPLVLIPAGGALSQPSETLESTKFKEFLTEVTEAYDLVIIDTAPLLPVSDTRELVPNVDAVLLCVRLEQTTRTQARAAQLALKHLPERPVGLVITGVRSRDADYYYGYYSNEPGPAPSRS